MRRRINHSICTNTQVATVGAAAAGTDVADRAATVAAGVAAGTAAVRLPIAVAHWWRW